MDRIFAEHILGNFSLEKDADSSKFILTNRGGYFYYNSETKYKGLFFPEKDTEKNWSLFKTLDEIRIDCNDKAIINRFGHFERLTDKGIMKYRLDEGCLILESSVKGDYVFSLDMREIYDFSDQGRIYNIYEESGCIIIEYKKFTSNILENISYVRFLAIKTDITNFEKISLWRETYCKEDEERKSYPWKLYVFDAFKLKANRKNKTVIAFSNDKEKAIESAKSVFEKGESSLYEEKKISSTIERAIAYNCAAKSIEDLYVEFNDNKGFYAGLPWFFQFWTRDEAISMKGIMHLEKLKEAKEILLKRINTFDEKGRLQNRFPYSLLATADGTGWVFRRIYDLLLILDEKNQKESYFSRDEILWIKEQLKNSIHKHVSSLCDNLLIKNNGNETWMDTSYGGDTRQGYRIEIQALWLCMLKLSNYLDESLGEAKEFGKLEEDTREAIRKAFFDGNILRDGKDDSSIRPNVFLAHYLYPELLLNEEWEKVFDNCLPKLWLEWGGLSTIDKSSKLFCPDYTGEDNKSYHRGDSWFFINNIAAISMSRLNKEKYKEYVEKIIAADVKDILSKGIIGRPSEISSASAQKAEGSLFQLWSAATFVELMKEN